MILFLNGTLTHHRHRRLTAEPQRRLPAAPSRHRPIARCLRLAIDETVILLTSPLHAC